MPHHNWFTPIPLGNKNRRESDKICKLEKRGGNIDTLRQPPKPSSYYSIKQNRHGKVRFGNHKTYSYRLKDIAEIYDIHYNTVLNWYKNDMLPMPFAKAHVKGWESVPIYLREQVFVICKVLDDIFGQGLTQFRKSHVEHIEMMQEGNAIALERMQYKAVQKKPNNSRLQIEVKPKLRKKPAPHMRPLLKKIREDLKQRQYC